MELHERPQKDFFKYPGLYERAAAPLVVVVPKPVEESKPVEEPPKKKPGRPKKVAEVAPEAQPLPIKKKGLKLTKKME